jgi:DNA mismatch repair protein MutS
MAVTLTPMMQQYHSIRSGLGADTLLLFRLGDFYEIFLEDAERGSKLLGITLTRRNGMPMAGIPYHAADTYIQKLLDQGMKVAICDQVETPQPGKLVERKLTRVITPGTRMEDSQLVAGHNQFLLAVDMNRLGLHASWLDLTTGEFGLATDVKAARLLSYLFSLNASELILPEHAFSLWTALPQGEEAVRLLRQLTEKVAVTEIAGYHFDAAAGFTLVCETLGVLSLSGFGLEQGHAAIGAAGAALHYATETLCRRPTHLRRIREYRTEDSLLLDPATLRNLEIFTTNANTRKGSLLDVLDATVTAAGARLLERWLARPLLDPKAIGVRHECVEALQEAPGLGGEMTKLLKGVRDLERILARLQNRLQNPRELSGVRDTLLVLPAIKHYLEEFSASPVNAISGRIGEFQALCELLARALQKEVPGNIRDGNTFADGYDADLDRLRSLMRDNHSWLNDLEQREQAASGIRNLRIRYNSAVGYFIEITKSNLANVPAHYIRKQTMKNAERFQTEELREREREILNAEERALQRENALFEELIARILQESDHLQQTAGALAELDVLLGWSRIARERSYCRPVIDDGDVLQIEQGRHPVVEQMMRDGSGATAANCAFVPNDTELSAGADTDLPQIALITGPNMAGKSTYIRQVALLVLMAQVGCWVPANRCRIGVVDRIFSRVGASDELARGNSTFMVEMNETANILNNATSRSLVILDEIGRGTSTYDGLSIAWAVVEHLHNEVAQSAGPRTLFATHYHELTQLSNALHRLRNYTVVVKEWNDEIIFVRQVLPGATDRSYGIQVARLAGLPKSVIKRAREILERLEADDSSHNLLRKRLKQKGSGGETDSIDRQLSLF